ncbi:MAG: AMP-binding protein [Oscillospiraceae bacterium]|nr:AMP-binding protein [Oscillospiraceae bacterium]
MDKNKVRTLQELIVTAAAEYGDKAFVREKNGENDADTSFAKLYENCRRLSAFLAERSGSEHFHAAVIGATSTAYLTAYFGTACAGNVIVPLDAQLMGEDLCDHLRRADVSVFFYDKRFSAQLAEIKAGCPMITTYVCLQDDNTAEYVLSDAVAKYEPMEWKPVDPKTLAAILYTSGTTGKSKGVMLSHGNLIDNTMCQDGESDPTDVLMTVLPIHHVYCFTCDILLSLRYGCTVCVNDSMLRIPQNLKRFKPTIILLVPMIAQTIYKKIQAASEQMPNVPIRAIAADVFGGRLKGIYSGGAYLPPELAAGYRELGIPISQGYGMTECSPRISTARWDDPSVGDVGTIVNGCEVRIVDGEIWAKSPSVMQGYYKNPEATAETLTDDGWLMTGDLGYVDEKNHIFITGRKKNLIILSNGENVSPEELENKFAGLDWLADVLVYPEDGVITAEVLFSAEFLQAHSREEAVKLFREQVEKINKTVTSAKTIHCLRVRDTEFDKTTSKKIKRQQATQGEKI